MAEAIPLTNPLLHAHDWGHWTPPIQLPGRVLFLRASACLDPTCFAVRSTCDTDLDTAADELVALVAKMNRAAEQTPGGHPETAYPIVERA